MGEMSRIDKGEDESGQDAGVDKLREGIVHGDDF
jgi:hypothetical protein